jgi:hypothetical protein
MKYRNITIALTGFAALLLAVLLVGVGGVAHADELSTVKDATVAEANIGVSGMCPDYATRGTARPSHTWEINKSGQYSFSGSSYHQTLYTNWKFKGKSAYTVRVNNTGSGTITVKAKTMFTTYAQTKVGAGRSATLNLSGMDPNTAFYLTFDGSNFSFNGYIR